MKLSTKGRYSVTALYELALHYGEGVVPLKSIAKTQQISENYLEQLMSPLRRAGLVESVRGAQGGYTLALPPEDRLLSWTACSRGRRQRGRAVFVQGIA